MTALAEFLSWIADLLLGLANWLDPLELDVTAAKAVFPWVKTINGKEVLGTMTIMDDGEMVWRPAVVGGLDTAQIVGAVEGARRAKDE